MMIATLLEPDLGSINAAIGELDRRADAFEIRFDACQKVKPSDVRALTKKTLVGTVRRTTDGGHFTGEEHDRLQILEDCIAAGFEFVDVEGPTTVPGPEEQMIRSRHEFRATPSLATILRMGDEISRNGATFKFASKAQSFADVLVLLSACRHFQRKERSFAIMGLGEFPRPITHLLGARFVYGGGRTNAPGQPSLGELRSTLEHWGNPGPASSLYAVVGDPIAHSLSPRMHNAAFQAQGIDAAYAALRVPNAHELEMLVNKAKDVGIAGLSVTTPLKDAALEIVTERTAEATRAKAVNAIKIEDERVIGHNTDGIGAREVLNRLVGPGASVLILGSGGAARAIAGALEGFEVTVAARNEKALRSLATEKIRTIGLGTAGLALDEHEVLVNATRVPEPLSLSGFEGALFDLRYGAEPTAWERLARHEALKFAGGRELLLEQGVAAYKFWTGRDAPRETMAKALGVPL